MASSWLGRILEKRIQDAVDSRAASLARGGAADYAQYQYNVGYVCGLEAAITILQEMEEDENGRSSAA